MSWLNPSDDGSNGATKSVTASGSLPSKRHPVANDDSNRANDNGLSNFNNPVRGILKHCWPFLVGFVIGLLWDTARELLRDLWWWCRSRANVRFSDSPSGSADNTKTP